MLIFNGKMPFICHLNDCRDEAYDQILLKMNIRGNNFFPISSSSFISNQENEGLISRKVSGAKPSNLDMIFHKANFCYFSAGIFTVAIRALESC